MFRAKNFRRQAGSAADKKQVRKQPRVCFVLFDFSSEEAQVGLLVFLGGSQGVGGRNPANQGRSGPQFSMVLLELESKVLGVFIH